jgi:hypothetical protein
MYEPEKGRKWRYRAQALRTRAAALADARARMNLEALAADLDRMASEAERVPWMANDGGALDDTAS